MFRYGLFALVLFASSFFSSFGRASDPPDPASGEVVVAAGSMGVVAVVIGPASAGGRWVDFSSNDGGTLDLVLMSRNGVPVQPTTCGIFIGEGDRFLFAFNNPTGTPIDVTVTMNFDDVPFFCPVQ